MAWHVDFPEPEAMVDYIWLLGSNDCIHGGSLGYDGMVLLGTKSNDI